MQLNNIKRKTKNKKSYKVGRGGKHAKTAGRGTKGQNARAGHKKRPEIRDFIKRLPKLRGRGKNINISIEIKSTPISLTVLSKVFAVGEIVTMNSLVEKGVVSKVKGNIPKVKILGGNIDKALFVENIPVSESVRSAIIKAGGKVS
jgi:large subunit ribosomal protein L15